MIFITNESELQFKEGVSAFYFYADWLLFHKKMLLMIKRVEENLPIQFYAIDTGSFKNLLQRFKVEQLPTTTILVDGKEVKRLLGITATPTFSKAFADIYESYGEENAKN